MANLLRETMIVWEEVPNSGTWSVLAFDGVVKEAHSGATRITSYPVDSGFLVSDHAIRQNRRIVLDTITSNISMSVATMRKDFKTTFKELMVAVGGAQLNGPDPYAATAKYGRPAYDNDALTVKVPFTSITLGTFTNPIATALGAQVSLNKLDETMNIIEKLNATGQLVHVITLRGIRKNCVITEYEVANDVRNAYALPCMLVLEQLNVVDIRRSKVQVSTNQTDGDEIAQEQNLVQRVLPATAIAYNYFQPESRQVLDSKPRTTPIDYFEKEHREVPYSSKFDTQFMYRGVEYVLGQVRWNDALACFVTILQWRVNGVYHTISSMPLRSGTNLVQQAGTNLPSLVAANVNSRGEDPATLEDLRIFIIEDFDETFL
ncbi:hypothetical protein HOR75_gp07 [Shewanella phage SppYZU05]|uniref:Dit-like phage tail protein N-terminal domain-containing protein n=1 Tax=Shewanella phage SppYZU05 TaxID=1970795 RepID=A0A1W6JTE4_9CAUD|nr:hypothetical protein HOR75_gp07 [Shewanella phage SppYZU05]ARM70533.1 hypothetical protein SppYZU05_07 [Shewanella phage SppYZU05]